MAHYFIILTKDNCGWCDSAKKILADEFPNDEIKEIKVENPSSLRDYMIAMRLLTVPQVWWVDDDGPSYVGGYEDVRNAYTTPGDGASDV